MAGVHKQAVGTQVRIYGLGLCFLMLLFFSAVKLAHYHSSERDPSANKIWQQDTADTQTLQGEHQQQAAVPFLTVMFLMLPPILFLEWLSQCVPHRAVARKQWLDPSLFLRPPPATR
jgi:hypothetical protein